MIVRTRRFLIAMIIYTLGVVIIATASYWLERQRYMVDIDARLLAAASNIPSILPTDYHDIARTSGAVSEKQDKEHLELMSLHTRTGDLTYLYSYVMDEGMIYFTSCNYTQEDVDNDQVVTYWTSYPEGAQEYFDAMTASKPVYVTAGDRWGLFRTILIPMKSPGGQPYVAAADMDITIIQQSLLGRVYSVVGISFLMLLLATPLVMAYRRTYSEMNGELLKLNGQLQIDIDQALLLEAELKEATQKATTANATKSQFLANMSHELRTPINGVLGMNDLLLDTKLSDEQREYAQLGHQSARVLLDTVNQILDLASIEAGGLTLQVDRVEILGFFSEIAQLFAIQVADKRLDLIMNLNQFIPAEVQMDGVRFRQVVINLISNAIKFTDKGGVSISVRWQNGILHGQVTDSGIGIPKEAQLRIFETFQQVDNSSTRRHTGTGLGLPISKQICRLMKGDLLLERSDKQGSVFTFSVTAPACSDTLIEQETIPDSAVAIVLTESQVLGAWLKSELQPCEVPCRLVKSANEAIDGLDNANLLLVDARLGVKVLSQLSEVIDHTHQHLVWLAWSGQRLPETLQGKITVLYKPLTRNKLAALCLPKSVYDGAVEAQTRLSGRVLLVDDTPINLKAMRHLLKNTGLNVDQAENGAEALSLCKQQKYDLVLMDVQMPRMDGLEATRRIRHDMAEQAPPIIGVSAHVTPDSIASALNAGMMGYLCKPITKDALLERISEYLS